LLQFTETTGHQAARWICSYHLSWFRVKISKELRHRGVGGEKLGEYDPPHRGYVIFTQTSPSFKRALSEVLPKVASRDPECV